MVSRLSHRTFVGLDIGSSSVKAIAVDADDGSVQATRSCVFPIDRPTAGGWEFDPDDVFRSACRALGELPEAARQKTVGVGVSGQMCGLVALDADREPVGPALPIFDDRCVGESRALADRFGERLRSHSGNDALPVYTLPKLLWLRQNRPAQFARIDLVVLPKDYVRGRLTEEWMTDPSDASGTLAYDQHAGRWDEDLLQQLDLPAAHWPAVCPSAQTAGLLSRAAADATGLPVGTPVAVGASDMAAVMLGVGATTAHDLIISFGTAAHVIAPQADLSADVWPVQQYTSALQSSWFQFGAVYSGAICAQWLVGLIGDETGYDLFKGDEEPEPQDRVLFMPYLAGAGAPHEVPEAAGAFVGLRLGHNRRDLARAVLDGLCFELARIYERHDPDRSKNVHVTGGGSRLGPIVQTLADVLDRELQLSASPEAAAIGAAGLGAAAVNDDNAREMLSSMAPLAAPTIVSPRPERATALRPVRDRYEAIAAIVRQLPTASPLTSLPSAPEKGSELN